jgi:hypothetical protein
MKFRRPYGNILKFCTLNNLENQEEMDKFLDTCHPSKLNQEDINNLNRSIISNDIKEVIKSLPKKENPGLDKFY